jgi:hypothetical protein
MWGGSFLKFSFQTFFGWLVQAQVPSAIHEKKVLLYYIYHKYTHHSLNLTFFFSKKLDIINFVKIKLSSPNIKNETHNWMQHVLQVYTYCTCHETTYIGPPIVCLHPLVECGGEGILPYIFGNKVVSLFALVYGTS